MGLLKKFLPFIGLFILAFIIFEKINFNSLLKIIEKVNYVYMLLGVISTFLVVFFKMYRTHNILKQNNINLPLLNFLEIYVNANILSQVTTILFSETTAAIATMHNKENKTRVANVFFLCNLSDLITVLSIFSISLIFNYKTVMRVFSFNFHYKNFIGLYIIGGLILIGLFCFFIKKVLNILLAILKDMKETIYNSFKKIIFFSIIIYGSYILACYFNAATFNIKIDFMFLIFVYTVGSLINIIPISVNGLGTREAAFIFLLGIKNIPPEKAFSLSFYSFVILILFDLAILYSCIMVVKFFKRNRSLTY